MQHIVFLHVPKCGGNSIIAMLRRASEWESFKESQIYSVNNSWPEVVRSRPKEENSHFYIIHGHIGYGIHEFLPGKTTYVAMLREPIERLYSYYRYIMALGGSGWGFYAHKGLARDMTFLEFLKSKAFSNLDNGITRQLAGVNFHHQDLIYPVDGSTYELAVKHIESGILLGFMDDFENSLRFIFRQLGWTWRFAHCEKANHNINNKGPTPKEIAAAQPFVKYDARLYDYARRLRI